MEVFPILPATHTEPSFSYTPFKMSIKKIKVAVCNILKKINFSFRASEKLN